MSDGEFDAFDIRDLPDGWFDVIQREAGEFLERMAIYPSELTIMVIQIIFQYFVYAYLPRDRRQAFLALVAETCMQQYADWDREADQEADGNDSDS
jgi:hypothetical protein